MPAKVRKISRGKNKGKYRVSTPNGVKARATTKKNAEKQARLLNAVDHGWKPSKRQNKSHKPTRKGR